MTFLEDLLTDLPELVGRMRQHDVRHVSLQNGTGALALTITANPCQAPQAKRVPPAEKVEDTPVLSPEMGLFRQHGLSEHQTVRNGKIVGFVEAGALRLPVTATADGKLSPAMVEDGSPVGYHDILFRIHPDG